MLFSIEDFDNKAFDDQFATVLPSADLLDDSTLDAGLSTIAPGLAGASLQRHLIKLAGTDALLAQQHVVRGLAMATGILSHHEKWVRPALNAFSLLGTTDVAELRHALVSTAIGTVGNILSAIPSIYTQIAAAVIGLGQLLYNLFAPGAQTPPRDVLPMQQYDDDTDMGQINFHVQRALYERDLTSLFLPRFEGTITVQIRKDETGRHAPAFGLGNAKTGDGAEFHNTGALGFIPGGRRITSIIQSRVLMPQRSKRPYYDPRCGGCSWSGGPKVIGRDVGSFYPSTNAAALTVWDHVMQVGPAMYEVDALALQRKWRDYSDAWGDGLAWLWNHSSMANMFGLGVWRCSLQDATRLSTVGVNNQIGVMSWAPFDGCDDTYSVGSFLENSLYAGLVDQASMALWLAQHYYLRNTTVAAYLHPDPSAARNDPAMQAVIDDARARILQTSERFEVRKEDVVDTDYRSLLEEAGAFAPSYERTLALDTHSAPSRTAAGLRLADDAPDPPLPPKPGGGPPLPTAPPSKPRTRGRSDYAPLILGLGAATVLGSLA